MIGLGHLGLLGVLLQQTNPTSVLTNDAGTFVLTNDAGTVQLAPG